MPPGITMIGLGPAGSRFWTRIAYDQLKQTDELYLRTLNHPGVADLSARFHSFESLFAGDSPDQLNQRIVAEIIRLGQRPQGVVYAVAGHPTIDEPTFASIRALAKQHNLPLTTIPGISILEATRAALNLDGGQPLQIVVANDVAGLHHPPWVTDQAALISHFYHPNFVKKVKQTLLNAYDARFIVTLIRQAGTPEETITSCRLSDLDKQAGVDETSMLYLPPGTTNSSFVTTQDIIAHLRGPDGCPWDREQTHQSLRPFLLEETYEVLEALDANDSAALAEELGDLLLQIVLHTQIAVDTGVFKMSDVIGHINRKLLRRHPHVFGQISVRGAEEVSANWEAIKKAEKLAKGQGEQTGSVLDGVPPALPALAHTLTICQRVARVGFEWPHVDGVLDKLVEEAQEIKDAADDAQLESEIGDFLFNVVNLARWYDVDPESALRATNARFTRRFKEVETLAVEQGKVLSEMSLEEMQDLWQAAKSKEYRAATPSNTDRKQPHQDKFKPHTDPP